MKKIFYIFIFLFIFTNFNVNVKAEEIHIDSFSDLTSNINSGENEFILDEDITFNSNISVETNIKINGNNHILNRALDYSGTLFTITETGSLEIDNLVIDGGASGWKMDIENRFYTSETRSAYVRFPSLLDDNDITATSTIITNKGNLIINNSTFKNIKCTATGCAISGKGNNTINNSNFNHICSSKNGGAMYLTGGETKISGSIYKDNVSGCSVTTSTQGGAIYTTGVSLLEIKENTIFEDNLTQNNAGALYIIKTNTLIENSKFIHNMCGNDGSAITLGSTSAGYSVLIQNVEFESNYGYATRAQSLGTIWLQKWVSDIDHPLIFKNIIFKNNTASTGVGIADNGLDSTYAIIDNVEIYNNNYKNGGAFYFQGTIVNVNNINSHDNKCIYDELDEGNTCRGAGIFMRSASPVTINNMNVTNNEGSAVCVLAGKININNSSITNNHGKHSDGGGGIQVRGNEKEYMVDMTINNTIIKNNTSKSYGGGISINDDEDVFSKITIDNQSKIYDNKSEISGDDFAYRRANYTENTTNNTITLDNISVAGITGIDGWYHDNENARYITTTIPSSFNDYVDYTGTGLFLKAGGLSNLDYDLVEGENDDITPVVIRYGVPYVVTDEEPTKDGYTFVNWNTKPDGTGITLNPGDNYDGSEGYILYAQYKVKNITNPKTYDGINDSFIILMISTTLLSIIGLFKINKKCN